MPGEGFSLISITISSFGSFSAVNRPGKERANSGANVFTMPT